MASSHSLFYLTKLLNYVIGDNTMKFRIPLEWRIIILLAVCVYIGLM